MFNIDVNRSRRGEVEAASGCAGANDDAALSN